MKYRLSQDECGHEGRWDELCDVCGWEDPAMNISNVPDKKELNAPDKKELKFLVKIKSVAIGFAKVWKAHFEKEDK